jgi:hypothetical protein
MGDFIKQRVELLYHFANRAPALIQQHPARDVHLLVKRQPGALSLSLDKSRDDCQQIRGGIRRSGRATGYSEVVPDGLAATILRGVE